MQTVAEIKKAVTTLPEDQYEEFSAWFADFEEKRWDRQIEKDQTSGPLRDLMDKARVDFKSGECNRI